MKRIALAMTLTALAAPASAFTSQNTPDADLTALATSNSSQAQQQVDTGEFGPIHAWWGQRLEAFKKRQAGDQSGGVDDAPRYGHRNDDRKRNVPRRQQVDPGDPGRRRGADPGNAGDPGKK